MLPADTCSRSILASIMLANSRVSSTEGAPGHQFVGAQPVLDGNGRCLSCSRTASSTSRAKLGSFLRTSPVAVGTLVRDRGEEAAQQVAMTTVDHDHVHARVPAARRRIGESADDGLYVLGGHLGGPAEPFVVQLDGGDGAVSLDGLDEDRQAVDRGVVGKAQYVRPPVFAGVLVVDRASHLWSQHRLRLWLCGGTTQQLTRDEIVLRRQEGYGRRALDPVLRREPADLQGFEHMHVASHRAILSPNDPAAATL